MDKLSLDIIKKKQTELDGLKAFLKKDFIGLDEVIDQIVESIKVWYIFPELQIRPTIVCLWGLTGVGKTDLIRKMISYLKLQDKFLEIEMKGEQGSSYSSTTIQGRMEESSISSEEPCILFLDEFQKFRTIMDNGTPNTENKAYSDVWTLLSDGRFHADLTKKTELLMQLLSSKYYSDWRNSGTEEDDEASKKKRRERIYKTDVYLARRVKRLFRLEDSVEDIMKYNDEQIFELYERYSKDLTIFEGEVYKKLLIIISGNLDEAYTVANDVDEVDLDADWYHEFSKKITVINIKQALTRRFRPEQIARFGNTHILYPSLSKNNFHQIIQAKCAEIGKLVESTKGIRVDFDKSVYETIYKNGVFPTQGVRPLLSTITNILSSVLPVMLYNCLLEDAASLKLKCKGNQMTGTFKKKSITVEIPTVLEKLREKINDDQRHVVAVHELGHAIAYTLLFGATPAQICTDSINSYHSGFVLKHAIAIESKDTLLKSITVLMAGRAAEEMVFGDTAISTGAQQDIKAATSLSWAYVGKYGFDCHIGAVASRSNDNEGFIFSREKSGEIIELLLKNAKKQAKDLLTQNMKFYQYVLRALLEKSKITPAEFAKMAKSHGINAKEVKTGELLSLGYGEMARKFLNARITVKK